MTRASEAIFGAQPGQEAPKRRASSVIFNGESETPPDNNVYGEIDQSGAPFGLRYRIGEGNTLEEKRNALRNKYPEGDVQNVPVMGLTYRESPADQWKQVNPRGPDMGDVAQFFSQDTGTIVGSLGAAALTKNPSLLMLGATSGLGAAAGELAQQGVQELRGVNEEGIGDIATRAGAKGALDLAGTFALSPLIGLKNIWSGAGATQVPVEGRAAMDAAAELGMDKLPVGAVTDVPFLRTMEQQSMRIAPAIGRQYDSLRRSLVSITENLGGGSPQIRAALDKANRDFTETLIAGVSHRGGRDMTQAGEAIQTAVEAYRKTSQNAVSALYREAEKIAPAQFEWGAAQGVANDLLTGSQAPVRRVQPDGTETIGQAATAPLQRELQEVAQIVRDLDFSQGGNQLETAASLRTRLHDLKTPAPGQNFNNDHRRASQLYNALTETMLNPVNADPQFLTAYRRATQAASDRFDNIGKSIIIEATRTETPTQLAARLTGPNQVDNIRTLQRVVPAQRFREVQQAYVQQLLDAPHEIPNVLNRMDDPTLAALLRPADRQALEEVGRVAHSMHRFGLGDILERQSDNAAVLRELLTTTDTRRIDNLWRVVNSQGGVNGQVGQTVRSGILDDFAQGAVNSKKGAKFVSDQYVRDYIEALDASGMGRFLTAKDRRVMQNIDKVAARLGPGGDTGASIQAAEVTAGLIKAHPGAWLSLVRYSGVGRFLSSDVGYRILVGKPGGAEWTQAKMLRAFVAPMVAAGLTPDIEDIIRDGN